METATGGAWRDQRTKRAMWNISSLSIIESSDWPADQSGQCRSEAVSSFI